MDIHIFIMLNNDINSKTYGTKLFSGIYIKKKLKIKQYWLTN